jgi:hypothetical protein
MRQARYLVVASGLVTVGATMLATGCGQFYELCASGELCISNRKPNDKPVCDGSSPFDVDPASGTLKAFSETCSSFVSSQATGASPNGSKANPFKSLNDAVNQGDGKWVIACNNAGFNEYVTTGGNVQVYGGFSCVNLDWKRDETLKTELAPSMAMPNKDSNVVTLTLQNGPPGDDDVVPVVNVKFQDFAIKAPNATTSGGSSIGVSVDAQVSAELVNCDVTAGDGVPGDKGQAQQSEILNGLSPTTMASSACASTVQAGTGATTSCPDEASRGGNGGEGGVLPTNGGNGQPGKNGDNADATNGTGGKGDVGGSGCTAGSAGKNGISGNTGTGGAEFGSVSLTGITGGDGKPGNDGAHGRGGGGGGGRAHGIFCFGSDGPGASGGAGGSGGCGGKGGGGGKAGGSSIAIISLSPSLTLTEVTLKTGAGGGGGDGGGGTAGGMGGKGGVGGMKGPDAGSATGCDGGDGGSGGDGGLGGGGRGGHSIGVLYNLTPSMVPDLKFTQGASGAGGSIGQMMPRPGRFGQKAACWDASKDMPCSP